MSLIQRLNKVLEDEQLTYNEKEKIFEELLLRFLSNNKLDDFNTIINAYKFKINIIEEVFENAIKKDFVNFVAYMIENNHIEIQKKYVITAIKHEKIKILDYFLTLNNKELLSEDLIEITDNKKIIQLLVKHGLNLNNKISKSLNNAKIMYQFGNFIENIIQRGDIYTLKFLNSYITNHMVITHKNDSFLLLETITQLLETMITKKEFNHKNNLLNNFYEFLKQTDDEEFIKNILSISK